MEKFPTFALKNQHGETVTNDSLTNTTVIYFYPKDNTPGCTTQACDLRDNMSEFESLDVTVYGVSGDSEKKHQNFIKKQNLNFDLLIDDDFQLSKALGIYQPKKMFGKEFLGIQRTTYIIDKNSNILHVLENVKPARHLDDIKALLEDK